MSTSTMTKREILVAIVENPGWQPPDSSAIFRCVQELLDEGWTVPRTRGGWEATPKAIDNYPHYHGWPELCDPNAKLGPTPLEAEHGSIAASDHANCISVTRVETLLAGLLRTLPVVEVYRLVAAHPGSYPESSPEWEIARKLAEAMAR